MARRRHLKMDVLRDAPLLALAAGRAWVTSWTNSVELVESRAISFEKSKQPRVGFIHHARVCVMTLGVGLENVDKRAGDGLAGSIANSSFNCQSLAWLVFVYETDLLDERMLPQDFPYALRLLVGDGTRTINQLFECLFGFDVTRICFE